MKREQGHCRSEANRLAALYRQEVKLYPIAIINTTVKALGMSVMDAFVGCPHNIGAGALGNAADRQTDLGAASCNHSTAAVALCQTALYLIQPIEARQAKRPMPSSPHALSPVPHNIASSLWATSLLSCSPCEANRQ